jgi:hypothetical protein
MNIWQSTLALIGVFFFTISCSQSTPSKNQETLFFPLLAWDDVRDESTIKKMAECGINLIAFTPPELLDACEKYGVKAILFDERITPRWDIPYNAQNGNIALREIIELYNNHPAVYGYHLKDEPDGNQLSELGKSSRLVNELAPGKWAYINLPPGMGDWYDTTYVQLFVDTCKPKFISYDNYPIGESDKYSFSWGYWANLWDIRSASLRNNIPFHTILLTAGHISYRAPSFNDLALQVYGALAYGAQGLGYYKFVGETLHLTEAPDLGNWNGSPLDEFHDINPIPYYNLKKINKRVQTIATTLLKLKSKAVYHIGGDSIPQRNQGITASSLIQGMDTGLDFLVGEFIHVDDNSEWLMIVNKNLRSSTFVRPRFADNVDLSSIKILSQVTGEFIDWPGTWFSLEAGQGVLLRLNLKG